MKNIVLAVFLLLLIVFHSMAATETIPSGSFIVNLGVTPQTVANGLKPYGMIYDLLKNLHVPIKWVINSSKVKDGADFVYNGKSYSGGCFIITEPYRTNEVNAVINKWIALGVIGETITSSLDVDVYATLSYAPRWTLDKTVINLPGVTYSGSLAVPFFENAGIPASAYGGSSLASWKLPGDLDQCDDIFVLPHSFPTQATHQNLATWNSTNKGALWCACIASSQLENISGLNFLTTGGMMCPNYALYPSPCIEQHIQGTPSYTYASPADPVIQFVGGMDGATGGAESIYLPKLASIWRSNTALYVTQPDHFNIGGYTSTISPTLFVPRTPIGPATATIVAVGRGFGNPNNGLVMYQAGHCDVRSGLATEAEYVTIQRAFFNFSLMVVAGRQGDLPAIQIIAASRMNGGQAYPVTFSVPQGVDISQYKIVWSATSGQILPNPYAKEITYIPSADVQAKKAIITLTLSDACSREVFTSDAIYIKDIKVPKLVSPNGDGSGYDFLYLKNIEFYPNNEINIYNRWGNVVYHEKNYDNNTVKFIGLNAKGKEVPDGVYYYVINIDDPSDPEISSTPITGYFILRR
ncbi:MAG: gliding motility-associated C-terminal domain-containing protein [Pedobacter sp.]|nr:MAG: gliding motility-associated C-terminal domain-containing protein [Pedobacter sp.]